MCGIFAYFGEKNIPETLINGLKKLEYRGYDSAGIAALSQEKEFYLLKSVGKVSNLAKKYENNGTPETKFSVGIAHTRWATHGGVTEMNSHPHYSSDMRFFVVHNGIIENYKELKSKLEQKYKFYSETDTEVIAKLIEDEFEKDLKTTIEKVVSKLTGAFAIVVLDRENPSEMVGFKYGSPLNIGKKGSEIFLSSDINSLSGEAEDFIILEDSDIVVVKNGDYKIFSSGKEVFRNIENIDFSENSYELGNFKTFTEKEIFEIPETIKNALGGRIDFVSKKVINETLLELAENKNIEKIEIIASGSSYFAGQMGSYYFKELAGIPCNMTISSEFLCTSFLPDSKTLYLFLSQSGETADVRESLKIVKEKNCKTFSVVNVVGSTIARLADDGLYSHSGVEAGVASTKNVISQVAILLSMAIAMGTKRNLQHNLSREIISELGNIGNIIEEVFKKRDEIKLLAEKYNSYESMFFLGRHLLYPVASECSLKIKELSYLHTESYSTGELKHGPLALVGPEFPCIVLNTDSDFFHKTVSNIEEIKARKGKVLGIVTRGKGDKDLYDDMIELPSVNQFLAPFVILPAMYLFSLFVAESLGRDVDKPRNLAKSVTVE